MRRIHIVARPSVDSMGKEHPKIVIAGGGVAALEVLLGLRRLLGERAEVTLITPQDRVRLPADGDHRAVRWPALPSFDLTELLSTSGRI